MEINFAKFIDNIVSKNKESKREAFEKVKQFIEITKSTGGLTNIEERFITEKLTEENIRQFILSGISFSRVYNNFVAQNSVSSESYSIKNYSQDRCGTASHYDRRESLSSDRCGQPVNDRCGNQVSAKCGGYPSRGC